MAKFNRSNPAANAAEDKVEHLYPFPEPKTDQRQNLEQSLFRTTSVGEPADAADIRKQPRSNIWRYAFVVAIGILIMGVTALWWGPFRVTHRPLSRPLVTSIDPVIPIRRNLDQTVTVYGSDFQDGMTVTVYYPGGVGRLSGTQLQDVSSASFQMVVLLGVPGEYSIVVNNPDGTHSNRFTFQVKHETAGSKQLD